MAGNADKAALAGAASALIWNQSVAAAAAADIVGQRLGLTVANPLEAGGGSLAEEKQTLARLEGTADPVIVLTPGWEPPLLEFVDFLGELRAAIGPAPSIVVLPVAEPGSELTAVERENWRRAVGRSADPRAYVETGDA